MITSLLQIQTSARYELRFFSILKGTTSKEEPKAPLIGIKEKKKKQTAAFQFVYGLVCSELMFESCLNTVLSVNLEVA